jgi:hypothetical protein
MFFLLLAGVRFSGIFNEMIAATKITINHGAAPIQALPRKIEE